MKQFLACVNFKGKFPKIDKNIGLTVMANDLKHSLATTSNKLLLLFFVTSMFVVFVYLSLDGWSNLMHWVKEGL